MEEYFNILGDRLDYFLSEKERRRFLSLKLEQEGGLAYRVEAGEAVKGQSQYLETHRW